MSQLSSNYGLSLYNQGVVLKTDCSETSDHTIPFKDLVGLPLDFYIYDTDHNFIFLNESTAESLGFDSPSHAIGKSLLSSSIKRGATKLIANCEMVMKSNQFLIQQEEVKLNNDSHLHATSIKKPLYDQDKKVIGMVGCTIVAEKHLLTSSLMQLSNTGLLTPPQFIQKPSNIHSFEINNSNLKVTSP